MSERRTVVWFSCGAASAVTGKIASAEFPNVHLAYCQTNAEHPDNERFLNDCERWIGLPVERLQSKKYRDTWHVWEKNRYLAGIKGAPCTRELKVEPRLAWQRPDDLHLFGYTRDSEDMERAERLRESYPEMEMRFPLIEKYITKANTLALIDGAGIKLPPMYALGFQNNNCIPCPKATSPAYYALIRQHFPAEFNRMAALSRKLGVRLCRIKGKRSFIDEIPDDQPTIDPIQPACDLLCQAVEAELAQ